MNAIVVDVVGQHFSGHGVTVAVESAACCLGVVGAGNHKVVLQRYRLRLNRSKLCCGRCEAQGKRVRLVRGKGRGERAITDSGRADGLLLPIDFASRDDRPAEGDAHVGRCLAIQFNHADNDFVAVLRLLKSEYADA